jgi:hypothetical protein
MRKVPTVEELVAKLLAKIGALYRKTEYQKRRRTVVASPAKSERLRRRIHRPVAA